MKDKLKNIMWKILYFLFSERKICKTLFLLILILLIFIPMAFGIIIANINNGVLFILTGSIIATIGYGAALFLALLKHNYDEKNKKVVYHLIYDGKLNEERISKYKKIAEEYTISESSVRDIFCKGAEWGIEVALRKKDK